MAFLAPLFFAALVTLAIPIVIHLTQRERKQVVEFPSLMFLEKIPYQSVRRRRIRDWPLLAMRLAAILLIVLAFARPFFDRPIAALANAAGPREVVILLDRSYSMGYGDRWTRAQAAARQAVQGLTADRSRHAHPVRHQRASRGARHGRSLARDRRHRRRQSQRRSDAIRAGAEAGAARARRFHAADARSRHDQRLPAQRLGARRESAAARRHHVQDRADYRRADGQSRRVDRAAAAIALLGSGARDGGSQRRQSRAGGRQQRAGAPRARRTHGRNADDLGARRARRRRSRFRRSRSRAPSRAAPCASATMR